MSRASQDALSIARAMALTLSFAGVALCAHPASACSRGSDSKALFEPGAAIPANVRGIPFLHVARPDAGAPAALFDGAGTEIAVSFEPPLEEKRWESTRYLIPASPLAPGAYRVDVSTAYGTRSVPLTITPAAPVPVARIEATAAGSQVDRVLVWTPNGSCRIEHESAVVDVTVKLGEDYRPYRPVARFSATGPEGADWELTDQLAATHGPGFSLYAERDVPDSLGYTYRLAHRCDGRAVRTKATLHVQVYGVDAAAAATEVDLDFKACAAPSKLDTVGATPTPAAAGATPPPDDGCATTSALTASSRAPAEPVPTAFVVLGVLLALRARARRHGGARRPSKSRPSHDRGGRRANRIGYP